MRLVSPNAGFVRVVGNGQDGFPLVPEETAIEVAQQDGTWIPLRGVCSMDVCLRPDAIVTASMEIEIHSLDFKIPLHAIEVRFLDAEYPPTKWARVALRAKQLWRAICP